MRILSIIQPSEMGADFRFEDDVWKVNFPAGMGEGGGVPLSTDTNNAIGLGTDEGAFISTDLLGAYALTQDNGSKKINLYRFQAGTEFNVETATLVSSVNLIELSGIFDDVAIDGDLITFTDADTGLTLTIDTANLQKVSDLVGSDSIEVYSESGVTTLSVKIDPRPENIIQVTEDGLFVDGSGFGAGGDINFHQTLAEVENGLCHVVGDSHLVVPHIALTDVTGKTIGYIVDGENLPVASETLGDDHCGAPPASNCRIGKVGVMISQDFPYTSFDAVEETTTDLSWRLFVNGVDSNYLVTAQSGGSEIMSLDQTDYSDEGVIQRGYFEEIISDATNGAVSATYRNGLITWNNTDKQVMLTLVPNIPVSVETLVYPDQSLDIYGLDAKQVMSLQDSEGEDSGSELVKENLLDYLDLDAGVINICLAPGTGGNKPTISCSGATDRFAIGPLEYQYQLLINGEVKVTAGDSVAIIEALRDNGVHATMDDVGLACRNTTDSHIRIEMVAIQPISQSWVINYFLLDHATNPTLMGHDPIAEPAPMALPEESEDRINYSRLTVCLGPIETWTNWDYRELDGNSTLITLTNSLSVAETSQQDYRISSGDVEIEVEMAADRWGDLTWKFSSEPTHDEITVIVIGPNYNGEYPFNYISRKPLLFTIANTNIYSKEVNVVSSLDGDVVNIESVEVITHQGSVLITDLQDNTVVDAVGGAVRIDDIASGKFSYLIQGRFVGTGISDVIKVKFVNDLGIADVVEVILTTTDAAFFTALPNQNFARIKIGLVDTSGYTSLDLLPTITVSAVGIVEGTLERENSVGGVFEFTHEFTMPNERHVVSVSGSIWGANLALLGNSIIGVDDWGEIEIGGFTCNHETYSGRFDAYEIDFTNISKNNLSYVPKEGPTNLQNMTGMFAGTDLSDPLVDVSSYTMGNVYSMAGVFAHSNFNGNLDGWDVRWVIVMNYAFYASRYRQDLSLWCVSNIDSEPTMFSHRAPLLTKHKPVWGTCPLRGDTSSVNLFLTNGNYVNVTKAGIENDYSVKYPPTNGAKFSEIICNLPLLSIGDRAFKDQEIKKVTFMRNLRSVGSEAFMNNQLETVTIYNGLSRIGHNAFAGNPLRYLAIVEAKPPILGADAFPDTIEGIYVPDAVVDTYKSSPTWVSHAAIIKPLSSAPMVAYTPETSSYNTDLYFEHYLVTDVVPENALPNGIAVVNDINEGVTHLEQSALVGSRANTLKIPSSLVAADTDALRINIGIMELPEGFTSNEFMREANPNASTLILPSTTQSIVGVMNRDRPSTICCKAITPPTLEVTETTHAFGTSYFIGGVKLRAIAVPAESIDLYKADANWNILTDNFIPLEDFNYGCVHTLERTYQYGEGNSLAIYGVITGTADVADAGKNVTILYSDYIYDTVNADYRRGTIIELSAVVQADGSFRVESGFDYRNTVHFVTAYIGYGNELAAAY